MLAAVSCRDGWGEVVVGRGSGLDNLKGLRLDSEPSEFCDPSQSEDPDARPENGELSRVDI